MKMNQCSRCKEIKSLSEFHKDSHAKNGYCSRCKKCIKKYRQTHKKERAKYDKDYCHTLIGNLRHRFVFIKQRCNNSKCINYKYYGGRGIKVKFKNADEFVNYVINELQIDPRGLTIDRIDNNGHYEKGNIRFVTAKVNANNKRKIYTKPSHL